MEVFAKRLKELRDEKNLSIRELAQKTGLSKSSISSWERAEYQITIEAIKILSKFFNVSSDYLIGLKDF